MYGNEYMEASRNSYVVDELMRCQPWIESALAHGNGTHLFVDVVDGVISGKMQLWPAENSCLITEIVDFPRKRILHIFLAGGKLDEILSMTDDVSAWAKGQGCECATLAGRKGWIRALNKHNWEHQFTVMRKDI